MHIEIVLRVATKPLLPSFPHYIICIMQAMLVKSDFEQSKAIKTHAKH